MTQVLHTRLPSLADTNTRPASQKSTQRFSREHRWSKAHCPGCVHSTQRHWLSVHTPWAPHWELETQSRHWLATQDRPDPQWESFKHSTFWQEPPWQVVREIPEQSASVLHAPTHVPPRQKGRRCVHSTSALHRFWTQRSNTHNASGPGHWLSAVHDCAWAGDPGSMRRTARERARRCETR